MSCGAEMAFFHPNFMLQTTPPHQDDRDHPSTSLSPIFPNSCTPQEFHGVASRLDKRSSMSNFSEMNNHCEDELSDDGSQLAGEKKRRLNMEQVKTLEKNFELGTKLEPERKMQLARALGLQPRQIAIWFQNRRARWKTKQLERDYDLLKRQFDAVKAENDALQSQNQKLQAEISVLKTRGEAAEISINLNKETEGSCSNRSENSSEIKLDISTANPAAIDNRILSNNRPVNGVAQQFFQINSSARHEIPGTKMDHQTVKEESLMSNMFCGMEDQTGFWPWLDQHNFN